MTPFPLDQLRQRVAELAAQGIYIGTSSWKFEGWLGQIYSPEKYLRYFKAGPQDFEGPLREDVPCRVRTDLLDRLP